MKTSDFCRKNGLVMQNHGLGIHSDKSPIGQNMLEIKRKTHWRSVVRGNTDTHFHLLILLCTYFDAAVV